MKHLLVTNDFPPKIGGIQSLLWEWWRRLPPESFAVLIDLLVEAIVDHLANQVEAGADAVQIFDSWAGVLPEDQLLGWSLEPMVRIAHGLRARHPRVPIIAFPRAVGPAMLNYRRPDAFSALSKLAMAVSSSPFT